jgi:hypothetical protein
VKSQPRALADEAGGVWIVHTEANAYVLDLNKMLTRRLRGVGARATTATDWEVLATITHCELGHPVRWMTERDIMGLTSENELEDMTDVVFIERAVHTWDGVSWGLRLDEPGANGSPDDGAGEIREVDELLGGEGGVWTVRTRDSHYEFDLDAGTVQRFAGPISNASPNDARRRLRDISACRVGARGRWTMWPVEGDPPVEYMWQDTSMIRSIESEDDDADR